MNVVVDVRKSTSRAVRAAAASSEYAANAGGATAALGPLAAAPIEPAMSDSSDGRVTASSSQTSAAADAGEGGSGGGVPSFMPSGSSSATGTVAPSSTPVSGGRPGSGTRGRGPGVVAPVGSGASGSARGSLPPITPYACRRSRSMSSAPNSSVSAAIMRADGRRLGSSGTEIRIPRLTPARAAAEDASVATLSQKVCQLLWCGFGPGVTPPPGFAARVAAGEVGCAVLFRENVGSIEELLALNAALHAAAPADLPLLIAVDQEGGRVQRVRAPATVWPPMLRVGDAARAEAIGRALGEELAVLGFDVDFAPVLDVHTNPQNPVIGDRAFATTAAEVIRLAGAFARGLAAAGILACGKHFPGHGDTTTDSHLALPRVDHGLARLRAVELAPFRALELPMLMTAHVIFAALDPDSPATLSRRVLGDLLRGELGYRGVVVSDDLEMKAIADHWGIAEAVERGLIAGCDAFLLCHVEALQLEAHAALVRAAERSPAVRARVDEAAGRVAALKAGHRPRPAATPAQARALLGRREHQELVS